MQIIHFLQQRLVLSINYLTFARNIPGSNIDDIAKTIGLDPRIGKLFSGCRTGLWWFMSTKRYESVD